MKKEELIREYLNAQKERKEWQQKELELFTLLNESAEQEGPNKRCLRGDGLKLTFKTRENIRVDSKAANNLLERLKALEVTGPGAAAFPFKVKYEPDKTKIKELRETEPVYYGREIAPILTVNPGKPTIEVRELDSETI